MLKDLLHQIGFSEKEIILYLTVLEQRRMSYTDVSRKTGMNRTTTYSVASELIARGVLQEDFSSPVKALTAAPPETLLMQIAKEEDRLKEKKLLLEKAVEEIRSLPSITGYVAPKITYIPEARIGQYLHQRVNGWNDGLLATDKTWWGFQDVSFVAHYAEWISWYWKQTPTEIHVRLFTNDQAVERDIQQRSPERREIRFWSGDHAFTDTFWIIGDSIITVNTHQKPFSLVEMRDRLLAQNLRTVFSKLWETTT